MSIQSITLRKLIDSDKLEKNHVLALANLLGKGCRSRNKERLKYCWPHGYHWWHERISFYTEGGVMWASYCAGQDYPAEIAMIRKSLLG